MYKIQPKTQTPSPNRHYQKDLQSTSHTLKLLSTNPPILHHSPTTPNKWHLPIVSSRIYHDQKPKHNKSKTNSFKNIKITCKIGRKSISTQQQQKINFTYTSPQHLLTHQHSLSKKKYKTQITQPLSQPHTPNSKSFSNKKYSLFGTNHKNINSLQQISTISSKYLTNDTPSQHFQQSQIIFKGSRDIENIIPMKLVYDDEGQQQPPLIKFDKKIINHHNRLLHFKLLKKSNNRVSLALQHTTKLIFSIIKTTNQFCLNHIQKSPTIYHQYKNYHTTYFICQPYQYTLNQLLSHNKIKKQHIKIILQHLKPTLITLCSLRYSFFQISDIQNCIFYIHGVFKLMPIYYHGQFQTLKTSDTILHQIQEYLMKLLPL